MRSAMLTPSDRSFWRPLRVAPLTRPRPVVAFGRCLTIEAWSEVTGISAKVLRRRLRLLPPEVAFALPKYSHADQRARAGMPLSWTWELLPYEDDPWAQDFVARHPAGASAAEVGKAIGIRKSRLLLIESSALRKLRAAEDNQFLERLFRERTESGEGSDDDRTE